MGVEQRLMLHQTPKHVLPQNCHSVLSHTFAMAEYCDFFINCSTIIGGPGISQGLEDPSPLTQRVRGGKGGREGPSWARAAQLPLV